MKLLYITSHYSGYESPSMLQVFYMCQAFSQIDNIEVTLAFSNLIYTSKDHQTIVQEKLGYKPQFKTINYKNISFFGKLRTLGGFWGIRKLIKEEEYDVIYTRIPIALIFAVKYNKKVVYESHNFKMHMTLKLLNTFFQRELLRASKCENLIKMISISENLKDKWIETGVPRDKSIALHDGISQRDFEKERNMLVERNKLGLSSDRKIIVYVGSINERRGIDNILKLAKKHPEQFFIIVGGSTTEVNKIQKKIAIEKINNIMFTGFIEHNRVYSYLAAADVLLMVFDWKFGTMDYCSPMKMFEYMAAGRIIVAQNFPTISEVLEHNKDALLANPDSFKELNLCLTEALSMKYPNELATNARRKVLSQYTWGKRAKRIIEEIGSFV